MELVRVDRREVLLGPQARDVDGVLAVGAELRVDGQSCPDGLWTDCKRDSRSSGLADGALSI